MSTSIIQVEKLLGVYRKRPSIKWNKCWVKNRRCFWSFNYKQVYGEIRYYKNTKQMGWDVMCLGRSNFNIVNGKIVGGFQRNGLAKNMDEAKLAVREALHECLREMSNQTR